MCHDTEIMSKAIWIHDECLHLALGIEEAFFVDDVEFFLARGWSFKRYVFLLSLVNDLSIEIFEGKTKSVIDSLSKSRKIMTYEAMDPCLIRLQKEVSSELELQKPESWSWGPDYSFSEPKPFMKYYYKIVKPWLSKQS